MDENSKLIPLSKGLSAIVDASDYELLAQWSWHALIRKRGAPYAVRSVHGKKLDTKVYMHREILGATPGRDVDHINGNGLDNRRKNLRLCSHRKNACNHRRARGVSGFVGVYRYWRAPDRPWVPRVWAGGICCSLGHYASAKEAAAIRDIGARLVYGEFARLNFPNKLCDLRSAAAVRVRSCLAKRGLIS